jgi:hypothetical protein
MGFPCSRPLAALLAAAALFGSCAGPEAHAEVDPEPWPVPGRWTEGDLRHATLLLEGPGGNTTGVLEAPFPFEELLLSWNVTLDDVIPEVCFEVRVRGHRGWSTWQHLGDANGGPVRGEGWCRAAREGEAAASVLHVSGFGDLASLISEDELVDLASVDVDVLRSEEELHAFELRWSQTYGGSLIEMLVHRLAITVSRTPDPAAPESRSELAGLANREPASVPFRSQRWEAAELAPRVCSPTSVAMVLAGYGVEESTERVAEHAYDSEHDLYGNWPRNVQAAFLLGAPGYLTRFSAWPRVEQLVASGQPLVISLRVEPGELPGAPYDSTPGHLIVLYGFDEDGNPMVLDPAAETEEAGRLVHSREALARVWLERKGVAYVIQAPRR